MWREVLRVLKPGGHLVAFGGTRTYHRMACAIEDAGFEIRDTLAWMYGSGFPKSMDVSKAIGGMHRGALNVEPDSTGSHIWSGEQTSNEAVTDAAKQWEGWGTALKPAYEPIVLARKPIKGTVAANVLTHGTGALNIDATRIAATDADEGRVRHGGGTNGVYAQDDWGGRRPTRQRWDLRCPPVAGPPTCF